MLRLIARLNIGGPARHTVILNHGLQRNGFETLLAYGCLGPAEGGLEDFARRRDVCTFYVPQLGRQVRPLDDLRAFVKVVQLVWRWHPDVIHTHTAKAGVIGRLAAVLYNATRPQRRRCAIVHTFHGHVFSNYFGSFGSLVVKSIEKALAMVTDRIIAISVTQRDDLVDRFRVARSSRVAVVPLGLELDELLRREPHFKGLRATLGFGGDDFVLGFVGRLVPVKDVETLIRAAALARRHLPALRVVVAGDGECRSSLEALTRELQISEHVRFLGWQRELEDLYASFDLFALTSLNEGTPVALIEAMAAGVPVVATSVGGVCDVVRDGESGILIAARDPVALSDAVCMVADDPARFAAMAAHARRDVARGYGAGRLVEEIAALYEQVLTERRGTPRFEPVVSPTGTVQH